MDEDLNCPRCGHNMGVHAVVVEGEIYFWLCLPCDYAFAELWPGEVKRTDISRAHALAYNEERGS